MLGHHPGRVIELQSGNVSSNTYYVIAKHGDQYGFTTNKDRAMKAAKNVKKSLANKNSHSSLLYMASNNQYGDQNTIGTFTQKGQTYTFNPSNSSFVLKSKATVTPANKKVKNTLTINGSKYTATTWGQHGNKWVKLDQTKGTVKELK